MFSENDYHYLEVLLGLCSAFYHRLRLLSRKKDLHQLIAHLIIQHTIDIKEVSWPTGFQGVCFQQQWRIVIQGLTTSFPSRGYLPSRT